MSPTPLSRLHACALLILFCSSSISCFPNNWNNCTSVNNRCGNFNFSYPFGNRSSHCGDPSFQLACHPEVHRPLLNISGNEYQILHPYVLNNNSVNHSITVTINNFCGNRGKILDNYTQSWLDDSKNFRVASGYSNLTFWRDCDQRKLSRKNHILKTVELCGNVWHFSSSEEIDFNGTLLCKTHLELPIKKEVLQSNHSIINETFLGQGFEMKWQVDSYRDQNCGACLISRGICGFNKSTEFLCYCPDGTSQPDKCRGGRKKSASMRANCYIVGSVAGLTALAVIAFMIFYVKKRKALSRDFTTGFNKHKRRDPEAAGLSGINISNLPIFSYEELCQATNYFDEENEVGDGGFASVYFGKLGDGRSVAVKRLYHDNVRRVEQFVNEVMAFSTLNHPHVVRLYGCSYQDSPELLLVYEFVSNGTLADHLHGHRRSPEGLPWDTRLNIAIQTAQALAFLHSLDPPIFHRDVKSSNILLDEDFNVKIADFGLSRLMPGNASHVTTAPLGTPGYVDPEYHQYYQLTEKSDVYSFGVVLVEIISGKLAVDINRKKKEINLAHVAVTKIQEGAVHELVDEQLEIEVNPNVKVEVNAAAELAFTCLVPERDDRPHMNEVVAELEQIRKSQDTSTAPGEQWGSFSGIEQPIIEPKSPISVQDKCASITSTTKEDHGSHPLCDEIHHVPV